MNRLLLRSNSFIQAARRTIKKYPHIAEDMQATLELLSKDALDVEGSTTPANMIQWTPWRKAPKKQSKSISKLGIPLSQVPFRLEILI